MVLPGPHDDLPDVNAWADADDDDDDDYIVDDEDEQDLATELRNITGERKKMVTKEGDASSDRPNGVQDLATVKENPGRVTRSQRPSRGLGLQGPELLELLDENGRPYPGAYNNPLLDFFAEQDTSRSLERPRKKRRKTDVFIETHEDSTPNPNTSSGVLAPQCRRESSNSLKSVRFQDDSLATPPTTVLAPDGSEDTEDEDFGLPADEDGEVDESDKENAEPRFSEFSSDVSPCLSCSISHRCRFGKLRMVSAKLCYKGFP